MKYHLLQVAHTDKEVDLINAEGHNAVRRHAKICDLQCGGASQLSDWDGVLIHDYDHMADIDANDLDEAYAIGQSRDRHIHPEVQMIIDNPEQAKRFHSISVGDILINSVTHEVWGVHDYGFINLECDPADLEGLLWDAEGNMVKINKEVA